MPRIARDNKNRGISVTTVLRAVRRAVGRLGAIGELGVIKGCLHWEKGGRAHKSRVLDSADGSMVRWRMLWTG